ncbi:hypothetical protein [Iamia sp.]|uniref:hypothetical protein n=1 Tax=Iamia sp. TaxID=2722710 RepID=UPI002BE94701|nr:hypothetical protein [Iamia sp.]HXH59612.1 hypothetical protein [Iamia sp.]
MRSPISTTPAERRNRVVVASAAGVVGLGAASLGWAVGPGLARPFDQPVVGRR